MGRGLLGLSARTQVCLSVARVAQIISALSLPSSHGSAPAVGAGRGREPTGRAAAEGLLRVVWALGTLSLEPRHLDKRGKEACSSCRVPTSRDAAPAPTSACAEVPWARWVLGVAS